MQSSAFVLFMCFVFCLTSPFSMALICRENETNQQIFSNKYKSYIFAVVTKPTESGKMMSCLISCVFYVHLTHRPFEHEQASKLVIWSISFNIDLSVNFNTLGTYQSCVTTQITCETRQIRMSAIVRKLLLLRIVCVVFLFVTTWKCVAFELDCEFVR